MNPAEPVEGGIAAGTILVGKYRIESVLGRGGMGMVYRAYHLALDRPVAIKVLRRDVSIDPETVTRFVREAQAAVKLKSEHVARISDVGTFEDGLPFMVMELLDGADLGQLVDANGALVVPAAIDLVLQACDAIAEAHSLGIVHRDIKPSNLFVSFRPDATAIVKVLDFGISKSASGTDLSLTQTSSVLGTPAYMSPEQMRSARTVDARTDVWSLGTVLYELVEARPPFAAESFSEMCVMVALDAPSPMQHAPELEPIILRCLEKNPDQRYANVAEMMRDLAMFAGDPDAAKQYVTRAHRVLGLKVPTDLDSNPMIPRVVSYQTPVPGVKASTLSLTALPRASVVSATMREDAARMPSMPRRRRSRGLPLAIATAAILAVGGVVAAVSLTKEEAPPPAAQEAVADEPTDAAKPDPSGGSGSAVADQGSAASGSAVADQGSAASGSAAGSAATVERDPVVSVPTKPTKPTRPTKPKPVKAVKTVKPPPKPAADEPPKVPKPPPKPACDPFSSRTACK